MGDLRDIGGPAELITRGDVEAAARAFVEPLMQRFDPQRARFRGLQGRRRDRAIAHLEAFARSLWVGVAISAGGGTFDHWDRLRAVLAVGTNPSHRHYWGSPRDFDQRLVEMAPIAVALLLAPEHLWEPLTQAERDRVLDWLATVETCTVHDNNWHFFRVINDLARATRGRPIDEDLHRRSIDRLCERMLENGWWNDGGTANGGAKTDWYTVFAFHVFALVYCVSESADAEIRQRFLDHARAFAEQHRSWFAPDGTALAFGRSMAYRMAQASYWAMLPLAGIEVLPWGEIKGLYLRSLRQWSEHPIFDRRALLSIGYWKATPDIAERYISSGSPYWASLGFMALAVPESHPFWQADEVDTRLDTTVQAQPASGFVLTSDSRQVQALSSGRAATLNRDKDRGRYNKLAYATHFPFTLEPSSTIRRPLSDSTFAVRFGRRWRFAHAPDEMQIDGEQVLRRCRLGPDVVVDTAIVGRAPWHLRVHIVHARARVEFVEFGFALPGMGATSGPSPRIADESSWVESSYGRTGIADLSGERRVGAGIIAATRALTGSRSVVPFLRTRLDSGTHRLVTAVFAEVGEADEVLPGSDAPAWATSPEDLVSLLEVRFGPAHFS